LGSSVQLYSLAETPQPPPPSPAFGLIFEGAIGQTASFCSPLHASILYTTRLEGEVGEDWRIVSTPLPGETEAAPPTPAPAPPSRYNHCNENPIHVFLFWELRGLSPNYRINLSVNDFTDKKENQVFLINKEIQSGAVAKSYMTNGLLIYGEIFAHFIFFFIIVIYSQDWSTYCILLQQNRQTNPGNI
jgi:hypothetical protein